MQFNMICQTCTIDTCESPCAAMNELAMLCDKQNKADKTVRLRSLSKLILHDKAKPSNELRLLGQKVIAHFPEFAFIRAYGIKIGYVVSDERKQGEKVTYADCRKVTEVFKAYLPYDFIITFYERNTGFLNENQQKILMFHELQHIDIGEKGLKVRPHDVEDFKNILEKYGLDWAEAGKELPDILAGE